MRPVYARILSTLLFGAGMTATVVAVPAPARADDPAFVTLAAGWFDVNRQKNEAAEFRLEYRHDQKFWIFKPFAGAMGTSDGASYYYAGILVDVYLGNRVVVTPSFAPGYYAKGSGYDLGHEVEFRSQLELAYRFDDRSRLGISFGHMSNAGLGDKNPGTESLMVNYSIPLGAIVNMFGGK